jgi:hypothetical protein
MCLLLILSNKLDLNQETHFTIYWPNHFRETTMFEQEEEERYI